MTTLNKVESCTQDGAFRKPKTTYSLISSDIIKNGGLSLGALGLYSVIEGYYQSGADLNQINFAECSSNSTEEYYACLNELKEKGYLQKFSIDNI